MRADIIFSVIQVQELGSTNPPCSIHFWLQDTVPLLPTFAKLILVDDECGEEVSAVNGNGVPSEPLFMLSAGIGSLNPGAAFAISLASRGLRESRSRDPRDCRRTVVGPRNRRNNRSPHTVLRVQVRSVCNVLARNLYVSVRLISWKNL